MAHMSAIISPCGRYRYRLDRRWGDGRTMGFIMLNPSTADAENDDPTIRRCIGFAKREGCDAIAVVNLYALREGRPEGERSSRQSRGRILPPSRRPGGNGRSFQYPFRRI